MIIPTLNIIVACGADVITKQLRQAKNAWKGRGTAECTSNIGRQSRRDGAAAAADTHAGGMAPRICSGSGRRVKQLRQGTAAAAGIFLVRHTLLSSCPCTETWTGSFKQLR
jgi:hypothetical protein